jgi:ERCC4-type nuclease
MSQKIKIIVDTREKEPLRFSNYECCIGIDTLDAGDYSICGFDRPNDDESIIIERKKDCKELVSNLVQKWNVFSRELEIISKYKHKYIVVCGPNNFPFLYSRGFTQVHPSFVYSKIAEIMMNYQIPVIFASSREDAENIIYRLFKQVIKNDEKSYH